jgi:stage II sporulation protein D
MVRVGLTSSIGKPASITLLCPSACTITDASGASMTAEADHEFRVSDADSCLQVSISGSEPKSFDGAVRISSQDNQPFEIRSAAKSKTYTGILEIIPGTSLTVVNELPLEEYVRGVLPVEVPASFHPEAQKALAVAIRTYALKSMDRHKSSGFNLCDGVHCQGFAGASRKADWIDKIVEATRGQIAVYNGEPIYAAYSSDCGGATQSGEDAGIGGKPIPYLRSVVDSPAEQPSAASSQQLAGDKTPSPLEGEGRGEGEGDYCSGSPNHTWSRTLTADDLQRHFGARVGKVQSIEFAEHDSSGRVKTALVKGDQGECRLSGNQLRDMLGLKSTRMTLSISPTGEYVIDGRGFGHGIGLCAFGANGLARSREDITYVDILKHYYTGVEIRTVDPLLSVIKRGGFAD